ncbi:MAG: SAM-dependent methyltransferase [Polyangiaceae bacterium]
MSNDGRRPHISRIYDYVLGGTFNHEVDREAAEVMIERMPSYPRWARQNRSFLASAGTRWAREGRERVLDLGSGLPTQGTQLAAPGARILFTDFDEETVAAGRRLLGGVDHMEYAHLDLKDVGAVIAAAQGSSGRAGARGGAHRGDVFSFGRAREGARAGAPRPRGAGERAVREASRR